MTIDMQESYLGRWVPMSNSDVLRQLKSHFEQELNDGFARRIVIWHDPEGEFAEDFAALADDPSALADAMDRPLHCVDVHDGNTFETKLDVCRRLQGDDFLLYRRRARAQLEDDWLADVEMYAEHFQADYISLLIQDLGAEDSPEVRSCLQQLKSFFASKERTSKFRKAIAAPQSAGDIVRGVLSVLLGAQSADAAALIKKYLMLYDEVVYTPEIVDEQLEALRKHGVCDLFARLVKSTVGYDDDLSNFGLFAAHLLVTALSATMPEQALAGLETHISKGNAQFCLGIVREWMSSKDENDVFVLHAICRDVEAELHLQKRFQSAPLEQLLESDVFPSIDESILNDLMSSLAQGADRRDEAKKIIQTRRDMGWHESMRPYYDCVTHAVEMQDFQRTHLSAFEETSAAAVWKCYTQDWWRMDASYRQFLKCFSDAISTGVSALDDSVRELADWVDRVYTNWFLAGANANWVSVSKASWESAGFIEGISRQRRFYDEIVAYEFNAAKRVMVVISDGMRYEVAQQLADELERQTRGQASVEAMQSVFPSITQFGMASLLPHKRLNYSEASGEILVDGMPTKSISDRQEVLRSSGKASAAIQYVDLLQMSSAERKAFAADLDLIYVYHNVIDAAGHGETSGQSVFDACEDAVDNVVALVRAAVNVMGVGRVLVTSDHGFLYTRSDIPEVDQASRKEVSGSIEKVERRFLIADPDATSEVFINMDMEDIDGGAYTWWAPRDCIRIKCPGSKNYVHGGVSLQELCVPVVKFRNLRSGSKAYVEQEFAQIQLLNTDRRVTSAVFFLNFYQKDRVAGKVLPCEYELSFTDGSGNAVSDTCIVRADSASERNEDRKMRVRFALKSDRTWSSSDPYYLVVRNKQTGETCWTEEFRIEIAFAPAIDFGF